jgi:hypothetical protein
MIDIDKNIAAIWLRIHTVLQRQANVDRAITLVAVSKKQPIEAIRAAFSAGQRHFGENYLQEAVAKIRELAHKTAIWHFIGTVQSNKTGLIAEHFDWVHSVDRLKIAQRLNDQRAVTQQPINICLQVNIDADPAKSGVLPENCLSLARQVAVLPNVRLRGLMVLPAKAETKAGNSFVRAQSLYAEVQQALNSSDFDTLSMGMSQDFEQALANGATLLRLGTAIFGQRSP